MARLRMVDMVCELKAAQTMHSDAINRAGHNTHARYRSAFDTNFYLTNLQLQNCIRTHVPWLYTLETRVRQANLTG